MVSVGEKKYLKEGDANTTFFHMVANMRKRVNTIYSTEGEPLEGKDIPERRINTSQLFLAKKRDSGSN